MKKKQITLTVYYFDGAYDVEVYDWVEIVNEKGRRIDEQCLFGVSKEESVSAIEKLKSTHHVLQIEEEFDNGTSAIVTQLEKMKMPSFERIDEDAFWKIISLSLKASTTQSEQIAWLKSLLNRLPEEKTIAFCEILVNILNKTKHHPNFRESYEMSGLWGGDDTVSDFASWLVSQGKAAHFWMLNKPSTFELQVKNCLLDTDGSPTNESFQYLAHIGWVLTEEAE